VDVTTVLGLLGAAAAAVAAVLVQQGRGRLRDGALADALGTVEAAARLGAVGLAGATLATWLPESAVPYAGVAVALAVGWSVRDLTPDLVAWVVLLGQGRVRPGRRVSGPGFGGRVLRAGLFAVQLQDRPGERTAVPNRRFLGQALTVSDGASAPVEVVVALPGVPPDRARRVLREAVFLAPWIAPEPRLEVGMDADRPGAWRVRLHVVEQRFVAPFSGSFAERVLEVSSLDSTPDTGAE
jgi:hypothetical protein